MAELRYVGTSNWERTLVKEDGTYKGSERVQPGTVVSGFDDESVEKILSAPRFMRSFVAVNGPEDTYGENYGGNRWDVRGNATPFPELDMGSTVLPRRSITRTPEDNPDGFDLAGPQDGPRSDNADLVIQNEIREKAEKDTAKALADARQKAVAAKTQSAPAKQEQKPAGNS